MASKKSKKKVVAGKKAGAGKAAPKKKATAKKVGSKKKAVAKKKATAKKTAPEKKLAAPRTRKAGKPTVARKPEARARLRTPPPAPTPSKPDTRGKKARGKVSAMEVHLGHVFSLRPRVTTSFRQADFRTARHLLQDETYASVEEAARAVAEKALDLTLEGSSKRGFKPGR